MSGYVREVATIAEGTRVLLVMATHDRLELAVLRLGVGVGAEAQQYVDATRVVVIGGVV